MGREDGETRRGENLRTPSPRAGAEESNSAEALNPNRIAGAGGHLTDGLGNELLDQFLEVGGHGLAGHDVHHLAPNLPDLAALCVAGLLHLPLPLLGEADAEEAEVVAVRRLHVHVRLDQRLPLAHHRAQLVRREVHALLLPNPHTPLLSSSIANIAQLDWD